MTHARPPSYLRSKSFWTATPHLIKDLRNVENLNCILVSSIQDTCTSSSLHYPYSIPPPSQHPGATQAVPCLQGLPAAPPGHQQKGIKGFTCQSHTGPETLPRHLIPTVRQGFRPCSPRGSTLPFAASHSSLQTVYTKQQLK